MVVRRFLVLETQCAVGRELDLAQRLEHARHIEVTLAEDDAVRLFLLFGEVLEVDAVQPVAKFVNYFHWIHGRANVVAKISTKTDSLVMPFHRL